MQRIPLKLAKPGMKLAKAVDNERGMTLCGAGTALTEEIIDRLSRMEVARITVEGHPIHTGREKSLKQRLDELDARFIKVAGDPLMEKIKEAFETVFKDGEETS